MEQFKLQFKNACTRALRPPQNHQTNRTGFVYGRGMSKSFSTMVGFLAILTWSVLALLTTIAGPIPPFQLATMTFLLGGLVGVSTWIFRPQGLKALSQPWQVWSIGVGGLCLYHCTYFFAIQSAPAVEVSLIAYLWPLLIVIFAALLPSEKLHWHHVVGVGLGLSGAMLVISKGGTVGLSSGLKLGHFLAACCAVIWAGYSVLSRRLGSVPVDIVAGYCLVTAAVTCGLHMAFEPTVWPQGITQWAAIVALGLFPLGAGFYAWDWGCKHGDIMVLGALSYAAPLLSVIALLTAGITRFHWSIAVACLLIVAGAIVASRNMISSDGKHRDSALTD